MWQQLSRSEKGRVILWLGFLVPVFVVLAVFYVWIGRWVNGVGFAGGAILFAYLAYKTVTSAGFRGHWPPPRRW